MQNKRNSSSSVFNRKRSLDAFRGVNHAFHSPSASSIATSYALSSQVSHSVAASNASFSFSFGATNNSNFVSSTLALSNLSTANFRPTPKIKFARCFGTPIKFQPIRAEDTCTTSNGTQKSIPIFYHSIGVMPDYETKSFEELRYEDYLSQSRGARIGLFVFTAQSSIPCFDCNISLNSCPPQDFPRDSIGTVVEFNPLAEKEIELDGIDDNETEILGKHQCITCMPEYVTKSLEELRFEDYQGRIFRPNWSKRISRTILSPIRRRKSEEKRPDTSNLGECKICFTQPVNCALYACGHQFMCYDCAILQWHREGGGYCPICRVEIKDVIRTYMS
ncbi:neuralized-like protein [Dinothrombium tinctorium]|uniref:Nuclear pore complex protein Nup98-Nup96 n=1 Tax=Dinothrombium tinctorium TaxID=1965070 RepID=A0A3S3RX00_9ACAR|nr:neuralized-like protein [Dinothrombium tinctorium]